MKMKTVKSCLAAVIAIVAALVSTVASAWPTAKLGLPAGYTRLDSITSTGTQYINTGVSASQGTVMDFSFRSGLISARDVMYFGSDKANVNYRFTLQPRVYNDTWFLVLNRQAASGLVEDADYRLVVDYMLANRVTLTHGDVEQAFTQLDGTSGVIYLFSGRDPANGSSVGKSAYTFYEMKLWEHVKVSNKWTEDMTAQRDFVPARRDSDGAIGLCDTVNGLFYPNEGTGEFIAGPVTSLGEFTVGGLSAEWFDGSAIPEPKPVVTDPESGARLTEGQDYTLSYLNNHGAGTATVVVTGIGSYAGTVEKTDFTILCESFADDWLTTADTTCQKYVDDDARIYVFTNVESAVTATMCNDCMLEQVLLVGGGGAGGSYKGGGGGAGGVVYYPTFVQALATGTELSMSVGAGGPAPATATVNSSNGSASTLTIGGQSWSALGGGAGGRQGSKNGLAGASGGGAAYGSGTGGAGTDGQGFAGGSSSGGNYSSSAGGGGAGDVGASAASATEIGNGGPGVEISITGSPVVYGGGGGAGGTGDYANMGNDGPNDCGLGGIGGGGRGGIANNGMPGTDGLGGGGGGGGLYYNRVAQLGGRGGNGTIILRFVRKGMAVADIPGPRPYTGLAVEPKVTVTTLEGDALVEGADYEVSYSDNVACGTATATVKGLGGYSAFTVQKTFVIAHIYLVAPEAVGGGSGVTWDSPMTFAEATAAMTAGGEIWVKKGVNVCSYPDGAEAFAPTAEVAIRGGFEGTEGAAAERPAEGKSTLDGEDASDVLMLANTVPVTLERLVITRGHAHGVNKTAAGALTLVDCEINGNGTKLENYNGDNYGRGLNFVGNSSTKPALTISRCLFAGNVVSETDFVSTKGALREYGTALRVYGATLTMTDTAFVTNGIPYEKDADATFGVSSRAKYEGAVLHVEQTAMTVERCRFVANRVSCNRLSKDYQQGSLIFISQNNSKVSFKNCLFAGNSVIGPTAESTVAMFIQFGAGNQLKTVLFDRCTFAYNLMRAPNSLIGPSTAAMTIRNSIFYGNVGDSKTSAPLDIACGTGGVALDYSVLAGTDDYIDKEVTQGAGLVTGDPQFVTTADDFLALIENNNPSLSRMEWTYRFKPEKIAELVNIDCHLRSAQGYVDNAGEQHTAPGVRSLAIDAGDPADEAWVNEPGENGGRLNAGAYAGTAEASQTPEAGTPEIDPEGVTVTYPNEWTQPQISFTMVGEGVYLATVRISCCTGTLAQAWSTELTNVGNGDVVTWKLPGYTAEGELITYSIVVESESGALDPVVKQSTAQGKCPPWAGKGGGANVMHVRSGADGSGDGSDWSNASPDICAAIDRLTSDKTEIWVAGDTPVDAEQLVRAHTVISDVVFRGGFAGVENALAERPEGTKTVFDQRNAALGLQVALAANVTARMERFRFVNSGTRALTVTAAAGAALTLEDCEVENNVMGVSVAGANDAAVAVKNCLFAGNLACEAHPGNCGGRALYVDSCKRLTIDDTLFASNGITAAYADALGMTAGGSGPILYLYQTKVTARNVRFIGNRLRRGTGGGGIVLAEYADYQSPLRVANSAFTNCLWMANEERNVGIRSNNGGGMVFYPNKTHDPEVAVRPLDFVNCTFAFNLSIGSGDDFKDMLDQTTAAGLNVSSCDVRVRNCIFYGNMLRDDTYCGSDIFSGGSATFDIDHSLFAGEGTNWVSGTNLVIGSHNVYASPRFVTTDAEFLATIEKSETYEEGSVSRWCYTGGSNRPKFSTGEVAQAAIARFNVHVRGGSGYVDEATGEIVRTSGRTSPAVDAGDPDAPYGREPSPNGECVNLGFYGNTPWATMSKGGMLLLVR